MRIESGLISGLDILKDMLDKVSELPDAQSQPFYKRLELFAFWKNVSGWGSGLAKLYLFRFYMQILQHVLAVVADSNQVQVAGLCSQIF